MTAKAETQYHNQTQNT